MCYDYFVMITIIRTALHWACKRDHTAIIQFLLANGADANIKTFKGECASNVASSAEALNLLGCPLHERMEKLKCEGQGDLPIVPHYLQNPPFPYSDVIQENAPLESSFTAKESTGITATNQSESRMDTQDCGSPCPSLILKIRVHGGQESDFLEVEVSPPSYQALLEACAKELEVGVSDIAKIRKLPNILVCKDHHVQRMSDEQELEVILNRVNHNNTT